MNKILIALVIVSVLVAAFFVTANLTESKNRENRPTTCGSELCSAGKNQGSCGCNSQFCGAAKEKTCSCGKR